MRRLVLIGDDPHFAHTLAQATAGLCEVVQSTSDASAPHGTEADVIAIAAAPSRPRLHLVLQSLPSGFSHFATGIALVRARQRGGRTLLIDCALPSLSVEALGLKAAYTLPDAARDLPRMDRLLLDAALDRHAPSGLGVLPLAGDNAQAADQLSPADLLALILHLRDHFDDVIVDTGGIRNPGLIGELASHATGIDLLCEQTLPSVHGARSLLALAASAACTINLVVEHHDPAILLTPAQIAETLGLPAATVLPHARAALANALNAGEPLVMADPGSSYGRAVAAAAGLASAGGTPSLVARLLGRLP